VTDTPTFGRWTDLPLQYGTPIHFIERNSSLQFNLSIAQICARVEAVGAQTLVISNPNNPTGAWLTEMEMEELITRLAHLSLIVIDESFIDFSGMRSAEQLAAQSPNTIVVKSLGKALGWHGIRLGYGVANLAMAEKLRTQVPYWNINGLASFVLKHLGDFMDEYRQSFRKVARDRDYMLQQLQSIPWLTTYPSKANFLLSEVPVTISGKQLRDRLLAEHGLFVRECSNKIGSSESFLRNVVRRPADIDRLVAALRQVLTH
jgi:histidinol-phosphate/aromatic aminotransferase/cobyric acid decarboxylase-like protein